jgi:uncharacterized lipoprotein YbaY
MRRAVVGSSLLLATIVAALAVAGVGPLSARAGGAAITGVVWQWQGTLRSDGTAQTPADPSSYTIELLPDGTAAARADCNRSSGTYTVSGNQITIRLLATTLVACPPGSLGDDFLRQLNDVGVYTTNPNQLFMGLGSSVAVMAFGRPAGATTAVTGVVTYRERIALPADAVVRVQLQDTSRADAPAVVLGEQVIVTMGRQVPIPFSIPYNPASINPSGRYSLRARIESGDGQLQWTNMQVYLVITGGNPTSDIEVVVTRVG